MDLGSSCTLVAEPCSGTRGAAQLGLEGPQLSLWLRGRAEWELGSPGSCPGPAGRPGCPWRPPTSSRQTRPAGWGPGQGRGRGSHCLRPSFLPDVGRHNLHLRLQRALQSQPGGQAATPAHREEGRTARPAQGCGPPGEHQHRPGSRDQQGTTDRKRSGHCWAYPTRTSGHCDDTQPLGQGGCADRGASTPPGGGSRHV